MKQIVSIAALLISLSISAQRKAYTFANNTDGSENVLTTATLGNAYLIFSFSVKDTTKQVSIGIYKRTTGQRDVLIRTLFKEPKILEPGVYSEYWDRTNDNGVPVPTGIYVAKIQTDATFSRWLSYKGGIGCTADSSTYENRGIDFTTKAIVVNGVQWEAQGYSERTNVFPYAYVNDIDRRQFSGGLSSRTTTPTITSLCADNDKVYYLGYELVDNGSQILWKTKIWAINQSSKDFYIFPTGHSEILGLDHFLFPSLLDGKIYNNNNGVEFLKQDIVVQPNGNFLFYADSSLKVVNKTTGALVQTYPIYAIKLTVDNTDHLWASIGKDIYQYQVAENGSLTATGNVIHNPEYLYSIAAKHNTGIVAVADSGEQIRYYNLNGQLQSTLGEYRGYKNNVLVTDFKFAFNYLRQGSISFTDDDRLVVCDPGKQEIAHYNSDNTAVVLRKAWVGGINYNFDMCVGDSSLAYSNMREYKLDWSKRYTPSKMWKLNRLFYYTSKSPTINEAWFRNTTKLSNGKIITLSRYFQVCEVTDSGLVGITYAGHIRPNGDLMEQNFGGWNQGYTYRTSKLTSYTTSPVWGSYATRFTTAPVTLTDGSKVDANSWTYAQDFRTANGLYWYFNQSAKQNKPDGQDGYLEHIPHLSAYDTASGKWVVNTAYSTKQDYSGATPLGFFDIGNGTIYAGSTLQTIDNFVFISARHEFHTDGQWAYTDVYNGETGLPLSRIGLKYAPGLVGENVPWHSGNMIFPALTRVGNKYYRLNADESRYGFIHLSEFGGIESIAVEEVALGTVGYASGLKAVTVAYYNDTTLSPINIVQVSSTATTFNTNLAAVTKLTAARVSAKLSAYYKPSSTDPMNLSINTDGQVQVWVNNVLIIDRLNNRTTNTLSGTYLPISTDPVLIELEYTGAKKTVQLLCNGSVIPNSQIMPNYNREKQEVTNKVRLLSNLHYGRDITGIRYGIIPFNFRSESHTTTYAPVPGLFWVATDKVNPDPQTQSSLSFHTESGNGQGVRSMLDLDLGKDTAAKYWELNATLKFYGFDRYDFKAIRVVNQSGDNIVDLHKIFDNTLEKEELWINNYNTHLDVAYDSKNNYYPFKVRWDATNAGVVYVELGEVYKGYMELSAFGANPAFFRVFADQKAYGGDEWTVDLIEPTFERE